MKLRALERSSRNSLEKRAKNETPGKVNIQKRAKLIKDQSMRRPEGGVPRPKKRRYYRRERRVKKTNHQ